MQPNNDVNALAQTNNFDGTCVLQTYNTAYSPCDELHPSLRLEAIEKCRILQDNNGKLLIELK